MIEWVLESAASFSGDIDHLILTIAILAGFWFLVAEGVLFYLLFRFREDKNPKALYIDGEQKSQKKFITIPHKIILVCDIIIIVFAVRVWYQVKQSLPPADETVKIIGQQWAWRFVHPGLDKKLGTADDVEVVDELHVVQGKNYHFKLESIDVLHSFSVPVFRLKQDAVPGRTITGWFKPTKTGTFDIQCAEMCGIGHGIMGARIFVETEESHQKWLESKRG